MWEKGSGRRPSKFSACRPIALGCRLQARADKLRQHHTRACSHGKGRTQQRNAGYRPIYHASPPMIALDKFISLPTTKKQHKLSSQTNRKMQMRKAAAVEQMHPCRVHGTRSTLVAGLDCPSPPHTHTACTPFVAMDGRRRDGVLIWAFQPSVTATMQRDAEGRGAWLETKHVPWR